MTVEFFIFLLTFEEHLKKAIKHFLHLTFPRK
jgi:hypothetical protein